MTTIPGLGSLLSAQRTEDAVHHTSNDFDPMALTSLADETGEPAAQRFLDDYLGLLSLRYAGILRTLTAGDFKDAMDAVLSLKSSSAIVGAARLSSYCQYLQDQLKSGDIPDVRDVAAELGALVSAYIVAADRLWRKSSAKAWSSVGARGGWEESLGLKGAPRRRPYAIPAEAMERALKHQSDSSDAGHEKEFVEWDNEFHLALVRAVGNSLMTKSYSDLRARHIRIGIPALMNTPERQAAVIAEHQAIIDALKSKDPARAKSALLEHIHTTAAGLAEI